MLNIHTAYNYKTEFLVIFGLNSDFPNNLEFQNTNLNRDKNCIKLKLWSSKAQIL